jgi:hypothetical protein
LIGWLIVVLLIQLLFSETLDVHQLGFIRVASRCCSKGCCHKTQHCHVIVHVAWDTHVSPETLPDAVHHMAAGASGV